MNEVVVIAGPTASGKTSVSIEIAKKINAEIISADSVQVYKGLDIGSAKIKKEEMEGIKHYMIDEIDTTYDYSMVEFNKTATKYIEQIIKKGKTPMIVGGTGFYIQSLIKDIDFTEEKKNIKLINDLYQKAQEKGNEYVHSLLKEIDEESYRKIHPNNLKKVIRAIEYYNNTKTPISDINKLQKEKKYKYDVKFFVLYFEDRQLLYERVDERVDEMIENGLVKEIEELIKKDKTIIERNSMQAIGYKEIIEYLNQEITLTEAINKIKKNTRHLVKRQYTWFKNQEKNAIWIPVDNYNCNAKKVAEEIISKIDVKKE